MSSRILIPFAVSVFLSAALVFLVQPLFARLLLPQFGGSPAVWNACTVFFQTALLAGYCYTYLATRWLAPARQIVVHSALLLATLALLPVGLPEQMATSTLAPALRIVWILAVSLGGPYLAITTTTPLIQQWFSGTNHSRSGDPYFLYAVSNVGSMAGLLAYPFLIELLFDLNLQQKLWSAGYGCLVALTVFCGVLRLRSVGGQIPVSVAADRDRSGAGQTPVTATRRVRWVLLSFVTSAALLAVTTRLTTDVAAVPLFWVLPLAAYLGTYINAFARRPLIRATVLAPFFLPALCAVAWFAQLASGSLLRASIEAGFFVLTALLFHGELALDRPSAKHLTEYYFWLALGGCLGGALVGLVAPVVFVSMLEFPITVVIAAFLVRELQNVADTRRHAATRAVALTLFAASAVIDRFIDYSMSTTTITCQMVGYLAIAVFYWMKQPRAIAVGVALAVLPPAIFPTANTIFRTRTFFGAIVVDNFVDETVPDFPLSSHRLYHGTTTHGLQVMTTRETQSIPRTYYSPTGPLGEPLLKLPAERRMRRIAVIGLGTGALNLYSRPGETIDFYEIDPAIRDVASNPELFTYLQLGQGTHSVLIGDGRLKMQEAPAGSYDIIVLDAFGSDAIPVHLLTVEALDLFVSRLKPDGVLVVHISNWFINLEPVLGAYAQDRNYVAASKFHLPTATEMQQGQVPARGVVIARQFEHLQPLVDTREWAIPAVGRHLWTDRHASILPYIEW